jgi:hypothetical protein
MVATTLLWSGVFALVTGLVYGLVGRKVGRPDLSPEERRAVAMFKLWWYSLAGVTLVSAAFLMLGAFGSIDLALFMALLFAELVVICLALWGLAYYLAFLFTGKTRYFVPLGVFYGVLCLWLFYLVVAADPVGVTVTRWQVMLDYANQEVLAGFNLLFVVLLVGPQLVGAIAYFTLLFRTDNPHAKYRIAMVSVSLMVWLGSGIVAGALGIGEDESWMLASRFISLAAALAIFLAYQPPAWVSRRLDAAQAPA